MTQHPPYASHPSVSYAQAILANLPEKTGRSLAEWQQLVTKGAPGETKERLAWLKAEHGLGMTTARMIVDRAEGRGREDTDESAYLAAAPGLVDAMYSGPKESLRPIHDALIGLALELDGIRISPCKTIVPFYREHVFAQIKPTTRTRVDFGLALKGSSKKPGSRLIDTGGLAKGDRITHRFALTDVEEVDAEVRDWLAVAWALDA